MKRSLTFLALLALILPLLAACGQSSTPSGGQASSPSASTAAQSTAPSPASSAAGSPAATAQGTAQGGGQAGGGATAYPADYNKIIEGSKKENHLMIYSNMAEYNWKPIVEAFNKKYPWIKVETLDLGSGEVFERYLSEKASGTKSGDLLVSGAPQNWIDFVKNRKEALEYDSPEAAQLPDWSKPYKGLYTFSTDPMLIVYNNKLLSKDKAPKSLQDIADLVKQNPGQYKGKVTTYDVAEPFGFAINWSYVRDAGGENAWKKLETILPNVRPETSAGPMVEKLNTGEYTVGYFLSGIVVFPKAAKQGSLLGWNYISDGNPLFLRGMAIAKEAKDVNSAKLMLDFILSHDGQVAVGKGGFTPYRPDVKDNEAERTYSKIVQAVGGEKNVVLVNYDEESLAKGKEFQARWKKALGR